MLMVSTSLNTDWVLYFGLEIFTFSGDFKWICDELTIHRVMFYWCLWHKRGQICSLVCREFLWMRSVSRFFWGCFWCFCNCCIKYLHFKTLNIFWTSHQLVQCCRMRRQRPALFCFHVWSIYDEDEFDLLEICNHSYSLSLYLFVSSLCASSAVFRIEF